MSTSVLTAILAAAGYSRTNLRNGGGLAGADIIPVIFSLRMK